MKPNSAEHETQADKYTNDSAWFQTLELRRHPPAQMTVPEAAIYIGISVRKLRDDLAARKFKSIRIGNRIIIRAKDIDAVLEDMSV